MIFKNSKLCLRSVFFLVILFSDTYAVYCSDASGINNNQHEYPTDSLFSFHSRRGYFPMLLHNFGEQATFFTRIHKDDLPYIASGILIGGFLLSQDKQIEKNVHPLKENYTWINSMSPRITYLGGSGTVYLLGATGIYSLVFKDHRALQNTLLASQALITSGVWVRLVKILAGRERPRDWETHPEDPMIHWHGPFSEYNKKKYPGYPPSSFESFVSGHSASAFSVATVFAMQYADHPVIPILSYSLAGIVAFTRMTEHEHWASDVFGGACIGYLCGRQVVKHYRKITGKDQTQHSNRRKVSFMYSMIPVSGTWTPEVMMTF